MRKKILTFKDFDTGDYEISNRGKAKKKDGLLKKIGKTIYKISTSEELRWIAGLVLTAYLMSGKNKSTKDDTAQVLSDIKDGRIDHNTLENARNVVIDAYESMNGESKNQSSYSSNSYPRRSSRRY
jgi:hypothetical protein